MPDRIGLSIVRWRHACTVALTDSETNPAIVMWKKVMERVHQNLKNKAFKQPANLVEVTVCRDSGLLPPANIFSFLER